MVAAGPARGATPAVAVICSDPARTGRASRPRLTACASTDGDVGRAMGAARAGRATGTARLRIRRAWQVAARACATATGRDHGNATNDALAIEHSRRPAPAAGGPTAIAAVGCSP